MDHRVACVVPRMRQLHELIDLTSLVCHHTAHPSFLQPWIADAVWYVMSEAHAAVDLTMSAEDLRALLELKEEVSRRRHRRRRRCHPFSPRPRQPTNWTVCCDGAASYPSR